MTAQITTTRLQKKRPLMDTIRSGLLIVTCTVKLSKLIVKFTKIKKHYSKFYVIKKAASHGVTKFKIPNVDKPHSLTPSRTIKIR